jgi:drug/metabolite transporter (DMT)-like permease
MRPKAHLLTAVVIGSNVAGNLMLSLGMKAVTGGPMAYAKAFLSPLVLLGVTLLIVWMLSRMTLMSWADLSYILPVTAMGYVLSAVAGALFLAEHISPSRWAGTLFIVLGIALVSRTNARTS